MKPIVTHRDVFICLQKSKWLNADEYIDYLPKCRQEYFEAFEITVRCEHRKNGTVWLFTNSNPREGGRFVTREHVWRIVSIFEPMLCWDIDARVDFFTVMPHEN